MLQFVVIGITDSPEPFFPPEVLGIINTRRIFSGGRRHHELVAPLLPSEAEWIDITVPLDNVFTQYRSSVQPSEDGQQQIVVFASGDPLFFGFANTLRREFPDAGIRLFPAFNSLQMLAHRLVMPYHDMRIVSLTGRPWQEFDRALIEHAAKIGVLTDHEHTPATISRRMTEYGYTGYNMHIGEHLGHPSLERVTTLTLDDAADKDFTNPNCVIITEADTVLPTRQFGIPDKEFALLDGREKMITKMPIRLLTLQTLDLPRRHVLWDIGFCTGSVSIEARLLFPHLKVVAFEVRPECEAIIRENARRHGAPGIDIIIGDFIDTPIESLLSPDAVFIGGHGGRLKDIMAKVLTVLAPSGLIVFNSVTSQVVASTTGRPTSRQLWEEACQELSLHQQPPLRIQLNDYNPIEILSAQR